MTTPEFSYHKLSKHCRCADCNDLLTPGEWIGVADKKAYCDGCIEAIQDAAEFDSANWAEMQECGYV